MVQGYLGGDDCSVRVRLEGEDARLNIKSREAGARRMEFEYPIPRSDAEALLARFCPRKVEKWRHEVAVGGHVFEIDEFLGDNAGLVVAELELDDEAEAFPRPDWLGEDVTAERRYYNLALVDAPFRTWADRDALRYRD